MYVTIQSLVFFSAQSYYWIGLTDIENEGNFTWNIDNTVASYTQWASGYGKVSETYDVVAWGWKDGWFDYPPSYKYGYICQRDFCMLHICSNADMN